MSKIPVFLGKCVYLVFWTVVLILYSIGFLITLPFDLAQKFLATETKQYSLKE